MPLEQTPIALIGAGPIGLEIAIELKRAGLEYLHFDKGQIASTIAWFPPGMTFFSSIDRIGIAGVPIQTVDQAKCSKEQYLAYLRSISLQFDLPVRTYEPVTQIRRCDDGAFELTTQPAKGTHTLRAERVILATGDMAAPRLLNIPGENLPNVSHYFHDPHTYFRKQVLIVGGKNSAVEAALRCYHAGAKVTLCHRGSASMQTASNTGYCPNCSVESIAAKSPATTRRNSKSSQPRRQSCPHPKATQFSIWISPC